MIGVSDTYKAQALKPDAQWLAKATVTLANGNTLLLTNANIMESGIEILDGVSSQGEFDVGSATIEQLILKLNNFDGSFTNYDFTGATIVPYIGLQLPEPAALDGGTLVDYASGDAADGGVLSDYTAGYDADGGIFLGTVEWLRKGIFTVNEPSTNGTTIKITADDNMAKFDQPYTKSTLAYPATLMDILADACMCCGVGLASSSFLNSSYSVTERPDDSALTFREVVSYVAQLAGCFARINTMGGLYLGWYDLGLASKQNEVSEDGGTFSDYAEGDSIDGGGFSNYKHLYMYDGGMFTYSDEDAAEIDSLASCDLQTDTLRITGVQIVPTDTDKTTYLSGAAGYVISIENNPLAQDNLEQLTANIGAKLNGFEFMPMTASCIGDPRWEAGDVGVVNYRGFKHVVILSNLDYVIREHENISSDAESESTRNSTRYSAAAKAVSTSKEATEQQFIAYDIAVRNLSALMANALGFYQISEKQTDGSIIEYMCDKPTLAESTVIWKRTINGFAISTDGGQTWGAGFTAEGNAIVKILTAIGINADWINVTNLNASNITTGNFNANLITAGKIQSKSGAAYFDLDNNELAATKMVGSDGSTILEMQSNSGNQSLVAHGDMYAENLDCAKFKGFVCSFRYLSFTDSYGTLHTINYLGY